MMDNSIFQTNYKGQLLKSWIIQYDKDAVELEIFYPYKGLSLRHEPGPGKELQDIAKELTVQLFEWCQMLEKNITSLKDVYFEYQKEREEFLEKDPERGPSEWYDKHLADVIPFDVPDHCKLEIIEYIGRHKRPMMAGMLFIARPGAREMIHKFLESDRSSTNERLIADYNKAQAKVFFGAYAQGCRIIGMHLAFKDRFGKSPIQVTNNSLLEFTGPIRSVKEGWNHLENLKS